jgi:hypothetical protein
VGECSHSGGLLFYSITPIFSSSTVLALGDQIMLSLVPYGQPQIGKTRLSP